MLTQLKANTLIIKPVDCNSFTITIKESEEVLEKKFLTKNLGYSLDFRKKYDLLELPSTPFESIVMIFQTEDHYKYWLPFFLSSVIGGIPVVEHWALQFYLSFKMTDIEKKVIMRNIAYNTSFLTFKEMNINNSLIGNEFIQNIRKLVQYGALPYAFLECKGLLHVENFKDIIGFIKNKIYPQNYEQMQMHIMQAKNFSHEIESISKADFLARQLEIDQNISLENLMNSTEIQEIFMQLYSIVGIEQPIDYSLN